MPLLFFLEAGTLLIKMWAPERFHRGRLSFIPRGTAVEPQDDGAKATATICFSLDGRVYPQTERSAVMGRMEILQLRQSLIRDYIFKIQRKLRVAAALVGSET